MRLNLDHSEPPSSQRRGKIARLPANIRHQLNLRLHDGHDADQLLPWLNNLPQVRQIIHNRFDGLPISHQNLSAWRQGGFQEWLIHRQLFDTAAHVAEQIQEFHDLFNCVTNDQVALKLADHMVTQMTLRFTAFLAQWSGGAPDSQTKTMLKIGQFIIKLQQAAYRAQRQAAELPAIRYRVQHEVQADLRHEIFREMIHEKALAAHTAQARQERRTKASAPGNTLPKQKPSEPKTTGAPPTQTPPTQTPPTQTPPTQTPPTQTPPANAAPATPDLPTTSGHAAPKPPAKASESNPIKVNQASCDNPPNGSPSIPFTKSAPSKPTTVLLKPAAETESTLP